MKATETFTITGRLAIYKDYRLQDGSIERVKHFEEKNVITLLAKQKILSGLYLSTTSDPITSLHIGIGGTLDPAGLYPKSVTQNLTSLYNDYATIVTSYDIEPTLPAVIFIASADEGTANGQLISEAGLFSQAGIMVNIKCFPGISKTSEFSISFQWTIDLA